MFWPAAKLPLVTFFFVVGPILACIHRQSHPYTGQLTCLLIFSTCKKPNVLISFVGCQRIEPYVKYHLSLSFVFKTLFILNLDRSTVCYLLFFLTRETVRTKCAYGIDSLEADTVHYLASGLVCGFYASVQAAHRHAHCCPLLG